MIVKKTILIITMKHEENTKFDVLLQMFLTPDSYPHKPHFILVSAQSGIQCMTVEWIDSNTAEE